MSFYLQKQYIVAVVLFERKQIHTKDKSKLYLHDAHANSYKIIFIEHQTKL